MSVGTGGVPPGGSGGQVTPPQGEQTWPAPDPYAYPPVPHPAYAPAPTPDPYAAPAGVGPYQPGYGPPSQPGFPAYPGYPGWYPPPPPPRRKRGVAVAVVAVVVVLALGATVVGVAQAHRGTLSPADTKALAASRTKIVAELPRLERWIEHDRGLTFTKPVSPEVLSDADFVRALDAGGNDSPTSPASDPDDIGTTFAAMGLVPDADTFYSADDASTSADVVGFYDDTTGRLVVRGTAWTPPMEYTLVHELTHALQDQTFDLGKVEASTRTDNETVVTVRALVEGDAERVADDYYDEQTTAWQNAVDADQGSAPASSEPIVDVFEGIPYAFGEQFVDGLVEAGGNSSVDAAFKAPPTTSAQLLHPDRFYAGTLPAPPRIPTPKAPPGDLADNGVLGELGLWAAATAASSSDPNPDDTARLDGWSGDTYVSTDGDSGACFVDDVQFTSTQSRASAVTYLRQWTDADHISVTDLGGTGLRLSACKN